ncbi:MAG: 50S ribosomal protein L13 [archaeon]
MKVIDATNLKLGRLASYVAQDALKGETIRIVNAEKAVVTGNRKDILTKFRFKRQVGSRYHGPFYPKQADRILKRVIRGMLPYKKQRGRDALDRIRAYLGVPAVFSKQKFETVKGAQLGVIEKRLIMTLADLSQELGSKAIVTAADSRHQAPEKVDKKEAPKKDKKEEKKEEKKE